MQTRLILVSFLTLLSGCALLSPSSDNPYFSDPVARVAMQERQRNFYPSSEGEPLNITYKSTEIQRAINDGEVILGMKMDDVLSVWGNPRDVETAGDPKSGNQRWFYLENSYPNWKANSQRVVYFEAGQVVGWEN